MAWNQGFVSSYVAIKLLAIAVTLIMAPAAIAASAAPPDTQGNDAYLALGDSITFGSIVNDGHAYLNANNFVAYPDYVGRALRLDTANAACPGETTSSFISQTSTDVACRSYWQALQFPLHVTYTSTQLDFATKFLASHKHTQLVTIGLGATDGLALETKCAIDPSPYPTPEICFQAQLPALLATISTNMSTILASLRATGFRGVLMVVNYYSLDYTDLVQTSLTALLNQTLAAVAQANGAVVADAFTAFQAVASLAGGKTCNAALLNADPQNQLLCDDHPAQSGHQLLAQTVAAKYQAVRLEQ